MLEDFLVAQKYYRTSWLFKKKKNTESIAIQKSSVKVNSDCVGEFLSHFIMHLL